MPRISSVKVFHCDVALCKTGIFWLFHSVFGTCSLAIARDLLAWLYEYRNAVGNEAWNEKASCPTLASLCVQMFPQHRNPGPYFWHTVNSSELGASQGHMGFCIQAFNVFWRQNIPVVFCCCSQFYPQNWHCIAEHENNCLILIFSNDKC